LPRNGRSKYDLAKCKDAYIRYLQQAVTQKATIGDDGEIVDGKSERARLWRAQAEIAEMDLASKRAEVVPLDLLRQVLSVDHSVIKQRFLMLPQLLAPQLEGQNRIAIRAKLTSSVREVLSALSTGKDLDAALRKLPGWEDS
jgi:phage terminase Nu1 subunit (DNA packaging protein)